MTEQKKERPVLYWGINLKLDDVMSNSDVKTFLESHTELKPLQRIHSTLLFVGRKKKDEVDALTEQVEKLTIVQIPKEKDEKTYSELTGRECEIMISGYGYNDSSLALDVESIVLIDTKEKVPSNAVHQHITLALKEGAKAMDSVKALLGEGHTFKFAEPMKLKGEIKGFYF